MRFPRPWETRHDGHRCIHPIRLRNPAPRPAGPGGRDHLRIPRRGRAADLRRAVSTEQHPPHPGAARAGGGARGRGLCPQHRQGRRRAGHQRPRRDQCRHRPGRRADGQHPARLPDRPGADPSDRQRRVPGGRHHRHHAAGHQAQLPGQALRRPGPRGARSVLRRAQRPARPGRDRPAEGYRDRAGPLPAAIRPAASQLPPRHPAGPGTHPRRRAPAEVGQAPDRLQRRRRHQRGRRRDGRADRLRPRDRAALHQHADGPRRLSGQRPAIPRHAWHARHLRSQHDHAMAATSC